MKIKDKTGLRREIMASIGNTGSLRNIWFYGSGDWDIVDQNTSPQNGRGVETRSVMGFTGFYGPHEWNPTYAQAQRAITRFFQDVEN